MSNPPETLPSEKEALAKEFRDLEEIRSREAKSRAVVLEILGDIPDADITPPKNVLFVCKLNPVTRDEDLKIIFSRFGAIKKCDIIKDYVTGDSLQYAFIEFETEESCNEAYFKMQNVLIDDRRIHVDFCQSVSGFWKKYHSNESFTRKQRERRYSPHRHHQSNSRRYRAHSETNHYRKRRSRSRSRSRSRGRSRSRSDSYESARRRYRTPPRRRTRYLSASRFERWPTSSTSRSSSSDRRRRRAKLYRSYS